MNRSELQQLAADRVRDAEALLAAQRWAGAYHLAGYAVECGLKACVLVRVGQAVEIIFADRKFSEQCWTHNLQDLVRLAGLDGALDAELAANPTRLGNWQVVKDWSELSRYETKTELQARGLCDAITDGTDGVLPWIKARW